MQMVWMVVGFPILIAAVRITPWFLALLLALLVALEMRYFRIRCPHCGRFPYFLIPASFARCRHCGESVR
jgi:hypothetical protein